MANAVDYIRSGGSAPRLAKGLDVLLALPPGWYSKAEIRERMADARVDLSSSAIDTVVNAALYCNPPVLRKMGRRRRDTRYSRIESAES